MEKPSTGGVCVAGIALGGIWVLTTENVPEQAIMKTAVTIRIENFLMTIFLDTLEIVLLITGRTLKQLEMFLTKLLQRNFFSSWFRIKNRTALHPQSRFL